MGEIQKNLVVFTIDANYIEPFIVAVESFFELHDTEKYAIGLVHSNIPSDIIEKVSDYALSKGFELIIKQIEDIFVDIHVEAHFNSVIFYRLLIPKLFHRYDKVLYLDSDILFLDNIDELFQIDMRETTIAAVPKTFLGIPKHLKGIIGHYYASGLLLINIDRYLQKNVLEGVIRFLETENYHMPDQDALNAVVKDWKPIDIRYGVETAFFNSDLPVLKQAKDNPAIIQFSGTSKPWQYNNRHPYKPLYWRYLKQTPFRRAIPADLTLVNYLKWQIPVPLKNFIKEWFSSKNKGNS